MAHILIAEDDPSSASVLRTVLQRAGYQVAIASDGATTLRLLEEGEPPDVLLLDWMLPGISGLEVCYRVRQRWDPLALPVLMVTARTDAESITAAFDAGANDYLTKPFLGAELRARIGAQLRTKRLVEEQRQFEERLRERDRLSTLGLLVSGVAHDVNNPLTGISGYAQLLLQIEDDPQKRDDLLHITDEVERCRRIVASLLSFARRNPPERRALDVAAVLRSTYELREQHLLSHGVAASLQIESDLPPTIADGHQLQQAFLNILLNAEQALLESGNTLRVAATRAAKGSGRILIEFFNDGPPIPAEAVGQIFKAFFTTKDRDHGTGLGLTICQRIVQEHGGDIQVESDERGTIFRLWLPARTEEAQEEDEVLAQEAQRRSLEPTGPALPRQFRG